VQAAGRRTEGRSRSDAIIEALSQAAKRERENRDTLNAPDGRLT